MRAPKGAAQPNSRVSAQAAGTSSRVSAQAAAHYPRATLRFAPGAVAPPHFIFHISYLIISTAPLSGSARALKPCAERRSAFHISYFIVHISYFSLLRPGAEASHKRLQPRSIPHAAQRLNSVPPGRSALARRQRRRHLPSAQRARHFRDASASTLAEHATRATLFTKKGPLHG